MDLNVRQFLRRILCRTCPRSKSALRARSHGLSLKQLQFEKLDARVLMAADLRTEIAGNEGYLSYYSYYDGWLDPKYGHERSGQIKATNPSGPTTDNLALGYDWSSIQVAVHATTVRHSDGHEGKTQAAITTDFEFANQIYAQAGITIHPSTYAGIKEYDNVDLLVNTLEEKVSVMNKNRGAAHEVNLWYVDTLMGETSGLLLAVR